MKVEIPITESLLKKLKALAILEPMEGGIDTIVANGLENWVDGQILRHITGGPSSLPPAVPSVSPRHTRKRSFESPQADEFSAVDASGISSGLSDDIDDYEEEPSTSDPEAFIRPSGGLTEEVMERDMRVSDPQHEAKVDASSIKEKKLTGSDSFRTPEQLFAEHSGLPTPPPVSEDARAQRRRKKQTGRGRATMFTGHEENTI